jgi:hypothetical protein
MGTRTETARPSRSMKKVFDNIQHLMIKALMKEGIEGMYLNIKKSIGNHPIDNIILGRGKLKLFSLKS